MGSGFVAVPFLAVVAGLTILGLLTILKQYRKDDINQKLYLTIDWERSSDEYGRLESINSIIIKRFEDFEFMLFKIFKNFLCVNFSGHNTSRITCVDKIHKVKLPKIIKNDVI